MTTAPPAPRRPSRLDARSAVTVVLHEWRALLGTTGRLLARYWLLLLGIGALGATAREWLLEASVVASRQGAVPGMLVFALVPAVVFASALGMLALLGRVRESGARGAAALVTTFGGALLLFLVLYEQGGQLGEDRLRYLGDATRESVFAMQQDGTDRIPDPWSPLVLTTIGVALLLRMAGARLLELLERRGRGGVPVGVLRTLVLYAELVWLVLAVFVVVGVLDVLGDWWASRALVVEASGGWADLGLPAIAPVIGEIGRTVGLVGTALVAAVFVPMAWLTIATIVYGTAGGAGVLARRAAEVTAGWGSRLRRTPDRLADVEGLERSWGSVMNPTGRWGAVGGSIGLVLARGWLPVLAFSIAYTVLAQVDVLLAFVVQHVLAGRSVREWHLLSGPLETFATVVVLAVTTALVAAAADRTLRRLGGSGVLRLRLPERVAATGQSGNDQ